MQSVTYIAPTLAAYVGEDVTIRYDPQDMAAIRIYHQEHFLCQAVCQELAGETVSLKAILRARRQRTRELRQQLAVRQSLIDQLLVSSTPGAAPTAPAPRVQEPPPPVIKRYLHD